MHKPHTHTHEDADADPKAITKMMDSKELGEMREVNETETLKCECEYMRVHTGTLCKICNSNATWLHKCVCVYAHVRAIALYLQCDQQTINTKQKQKMHNLMRIHRRLLQIIFEYYAYMHALSS